MKKLWNILRRLSGDNRGAGIVVVMVSMACVALMGASVLFMSYTAFAMRATERQASKDFYSAETAMDEIRAGVQTTASDAIAVAYKVVLEEYSKGRDISDCFEAAFMTALMASDLLVDGDTYDPSVLQGYVTPVGGGTVSVDSVDVDGDGVVDPEVDDSNNTVALKNVRVTYTAANHDVTTITSDLVIGMPDLAYTTSAASVTGLPQHAMIARNILNQDQGSSEINISGSAYVGSMDLKASGSKMTISNGTLVCAGTAKIGGGTEGGRLVTGSDVKFWAGRIQVNDASSISLNGETRVLDDLELAGIGSAVTLNGSYYGFGDGSFDANDYKKDENGDLILDGHGNPIPTVPTSQRSSAILVNGRDSTLNISGLNRMMLAGRAYISSSLFPGHNKESEGNSVGMMESVAVRVNQQMYLIDPADLQVDTNGDGIYESVPQNPWILPDSVAVNQLDFQLKPIADGEAERGFALTYRVYPYFNEQKIAYCFMDFGDPGVANAYFERRFSQNSSQLNNYLVNNNSTDEETPKYSNLNASGIGTLGYTISGKDGNYTFSRANGVLFDCTAMRTTFNQLKKTLIDYNTRPGDGVDDPYEYIVNTGKLSTLDVYTPEDRTVKEFKLSMEDPDNPGNTISPTAGIVVNNPSSSDNDPTSNAYVVNSSTPDTVRLIIASGNVIVNNVNYTGLIIAGGSITIRGETDITAYPGGSSGLTGVIEAFGAKNSADGETLGSYLLNGGTNFYGENISGQGDGWHLNSLVTYKNWTKN